MGWSIRDHFGTGPSISLTGLHFTPVNVMLTSLRCTKAGLVSSLRSSPSSGGGLLMTTGLLCTRRSRCGGLGAGTVATGLAAGLVFDAAGLAFDAFHPFFGTGAATSVLTQCCGTPKKIFALHALSILMALHVFQSHMHWPQVSPSSPKHVLSWVVHGPQITDRYMTLPCRSFSPAFEQWGSHLR